MDFYLQVWRGQSALQSSNGFAGFSWSKPVVMDHHFLFSSVALPESRETASWKQQMTEKCAGVSNQAAETRRHASEGFGEQIGILIAFSRKILIVLHH